MTADALRALSLCCLARPEIKSHNKWCIASGGKSCGNSRQHKERRPIGQYRYTNWCDGVKGYSCIRRISGQQHRRCSRVVDTDIQKCIYEVRRLRRMYGAVLRRQSIYTVKEIGISRLGPCVHENKFIAIVIVHRKTQIKSCGTTSRRLSSGSHNVLDQNTRYTALGNCPLKCKP